ncbi:PaaI family thioesterase [Geobacter sp. FeAm09]|uniref:PaaI family thioesterase n=1 Tax=Geobacter sp. FeAm09 TaxID=2597769 RepID=UPI0011EDD65D|nr:PaaI family thioesterase [Geobacter sp. FeAm09]QEM68887.1 PaaI family thioesterase [Geobacter sp. FeAm09]
MHEEAPRYSQPIAKDAPLPVHLPDWIALAPFETYLGMSIDEAGDGRAVLSMPFRVAHCQGAGLMHGGAITSLADTALAIAIKTLLPEGTHFATIEMSMTFKHPVRWGTIRGIAEVTGRNERDITGAVAIVDETGVTAATCTAHFRVKRQHSAPPTKGSHDTPPHH